LYDDTVTHNFLIVKNVAKALILTLLDLKMGNPKSRIPNCSYKSI